MSTSVEGDHLDASPSETVRRHAATFRQVRRARQAATEASDNASDESRAWPAPEVVAREANAEEVPASAKRLAKRAEEVGWTVGVVYSRGTTPQGAKWEPGPVVDTVAVRARRGDRAVVALWRDGKFAGGLVGSRSDGLRQVGSRELTEIVSDPAPGAPIRVVR
jgi:hypothetical protein